MNDLISRKALLEALQVKWESTIKTIKNAPAVEAEPVKHGRWKAHKPDCRGYTAGFICSSCGNIIYTDYSMKECDYNYCPNCGAKMEGDSHENP